MNTVSGQLSFAMEWLGANADMVFLLLASLALISTVAAGRLSSVVSIVALAAAALLYLQGFERDKLGLLAIAAALLAMSIDRVQMRGDLRRIDNSLAATMKSVRELEAAHERRQGFIARKMGERTPVQPDRDRGLDRLRDRPGSDDDIINVEENTDRAGDVTGVNRNGNLAGKP